MFTSIIPYEKDLFLQINHAHTYFLDSFMWQASQLQIWIPLFLVLLVSLIYKEKKQKWLPIVLLLIIIFVFCDQFSSHIIKPLFARPRPTHYPGIMDQVRTLYGYSGGLYGFISGHATNVFGFATLTACLFRSKIYTFTIYLLAIIIAYSRLYLGVHFISDVVGGAISGVLLGVIVYQLYRLYICKIAKKEIPIFSHKRIQIVSMVMIGYISLLFIYSTI